MATLKQGIGSAAASTSLANSLHGLGRATAEISRITSLNTQLQEQLLKQGDTISDLAKQNIATATGGDSFCFVRFLFEGSTGGILLLQSGRYPLADVIMRTIDEDSLKEDTQLITIGTLPVRGYRHLRKVAMPDVSEKRFITMFTARNGAWDQFILLRRDTNKRWHFATQVVENKGQVKYKELLREGKHPIFTAIDPGFPGTVTEATWSSFNGLERFCLNCK